MKIVYRKWNKRNNYRKNKISKNLSTKQIKINMLKKIKQKLILLIQISKNVKILFL